MKFLFLSAFTFYVGLVHGVDIVNTAPIYGKTDFRHIYAQDLLSVALEESQDEFGPFEIKFRNLPMEYERALVELEKGINLSVSMSDVKPEWLDKTIPVYFPLMKGLASFRLFFVMGQKKYLFDDVENMAELMQFKFGQGRGWSTAKILQDANLNIVYGDSYEGLFSMLKAGRFDLLMRGVQEILPEKNRYNSLIPEMSIADSFAFYTYLPHYFFVAKSQPRLAERLSYGLKKAYARGLIDKILIQHFEENLRLLYLNKRKVFFVENTNIDASFYDRDEPYLLNLVHDDH